MNVYTLAFLSTHSPQLNVGLLRFRFLSRPTWSAQLALSFRPPASGGRKSPCRLWRALKGLSDNRCVVGGGAADTRAVCDMGEIRSS